MKKLALLAVLAVALVGCNQPAAEASHLAKANHTHDGVERDDVQVAVGVDAPNLIRLSDDWTLGSEVTKGLTDTSFGEDWAILGKITYSPSLFDVRDINNE